MTADPSDLSGFHGPARLFPLPNLVLFPTVVQPLHVFEPRYRALTADALAGDRLIAMALLRPGWEEDYDGRPPIYPVACLGRIIADQKLEDGRYNLLLRGLQRVRIQQEVSPEAMYRLAEVEVLKDVAVGDPHAEHDLRRELARRAPDWFAGSSSPAQELRQLAHSGLPLGVLCDIFSYALPLGLEFKQELLETRDVEARARQLLRHQPSPDGSKPEAGSSGGKWPPDFSAN